MRAILPPPLHTLLLGLQLPPPNTRQLDPSVHAYQISVLLSHLPSLLSATELGRLSNSIHTTLVTTRSFIQAISTDPTTGLYPVDGCVQIVDPIDACSQHGSWIPLIDISGFLEAISVEEHMHIIALQYLLPNIQNDPENPGPAELDWLEFYHSQPNFDPAIDQWKSWTTDRVSKLAPERYWLGRYGVLLEMLLYDRLLDLRRFGNAKPEYGREQERIVRESWRDGVKGEVGQLVEKLLPDWGWEEGWNKDGYGKVWATRKFEEGWDGEDRVELVVPYYGRRWWIV